MRALARARNRVPTCLAVPLPHSLTLLPSDELATAHPSPRSPGKTLSQGGMPALLSHFRPDYPIFAMCDNPEVSFRQARATLHGLHPPCRHCIPQTHTRTQPNTHAHTATSADPHAANHHTPAHTNRTTYNPTPHPAPFQTHPHPPLTRSCATWRCTMGWCPSSWSSLRARRTPLTSPSRSWCAAATCRATGWSP